MADKDPGALEYLTDDSSLFKKYIKNDSIDPLMLDNSVNLTVQRSGVSLGQLELHPTNSMPNETSSDMPNGISNDLFNSMFNDMPNEVPTPFAEESAIDHAEDGFAVSNASASSESSKTSEPDPSPIVRLPTPGLPSTKPFATTKKLPTNIVADELASEEKLPKPRQNKRKLDVFDDDDEPRRIRNLELNRISAAKSRLKKRVRDQELEERSIQVERENLALRQQVWELQSHISSMRAHLTLHSPCRPSGWTPHGELPEESMQMAQREQDFVRGVNPTMSINQPHMYNHVNLGGGSTFQDLTSGFPGPSLPSYTSNPGPHYNNSHAHMHMNMNMNIGMQSQSNNQGAHYNPQAHMGPGIPYHIRDPRARSNMSLANQGTGMASYPPNQNHYAAEMAPGLSHLSNSTTDSPGLQPVTPPDARTGASPADMAKMANMEQVGAEAFDVKDENQAGAGGMLFGQDPFSSNHY